MIPSPPKAPPEHAAQPSTRLADFSDQDMTAQWRKLQAHQFFQKVLPEYNAGKQLFSDVSVWGSFGPMRRTRPVRGEPAMLNVGPTGALEWP
jgi:hypothetical protein